MTSFDPKAYLAQKRAQQGGQAPAAAGFDPKAYLAQKKAVPTTEELSAAVGDVPRETVIQEKHPDLLNVGGFVDRLKTKWLANSPQTAAAYYAKEYPDMEVKASDGGPTAQVLVRRKGERDWRVVDPANGIFSKAAKSDDLGTHLNELVFDALDLPVDIASGIVSGAASAAGGVGGGLLGTAVAPGAGTVAGALTGGAAAGAATSAALEAGRQKLGSLVGIPQTVNGTDVAIAGGAGAVAPLLAGVGMTPSAVKTGANIAAKAGLMQSAANMTDDAARAIANSGRGALEYAASGMKQKVLPWVAEKASGVAEDIWRTFGNKNNEFNALERGKGAITKFVREGASKADDALRAKTSAAMDVYESAVKQASTDGAQVDFSRVAAPLKEEIAHAQEIANATKTPDAQEFVNGLKQLYDEKFMQRIELPVIDAKTGLQKIGEDGVPLTRTVKREITSLDPVAALDFDRKLSELARFDKKSSGDMLKGSQYAGLSKDGKKVAGIAQQMQAEAKSALSGVLPEEAMAARQQAHELLKLRDDARGLFRKPKSTLATLRNADRPSNATTADTLVELDETLGTDLVDRAKMLETYTALRKPSSAPISTGGSTSTSKSIPLAGVGSLGGYYLGSQLGGDGHGSGVLGGGVGLMIGAGLGNPRAIRYLIEQGLSAQEAARIVAQTSGVLNPAVSAPLSTWNMIKNNN